MVPVMMKAQMTPTWDDLQNRRSRWTTVMARVKPTVTVEQAEAAMTGAEAFVGKITPAMLARADRLRWVQSFTASLEHYMFPQLEVHPWQDGPLHGDRFVVLEIPARSQ